MFGKLGSAVVSGAKKVGEAHVAVGSAVADAGKSAVSAVVDSKGDPGSRCNVMAREAASFSEQLKKAEKDLRALAAAAETLLDGGRAALASPLPRALQEAPGAAGGPAADLVGGTACDGQALTKAKLDLSQRLQTEVYQPLLAWQSAFKDAEAKQKTVNKLFGEQEAARKKLEAGKTKAAELQAKAGADPKAREKADEAARQVPQLEGALQVATSRHTSEEAEQHAKLLPLVQEAAKLRGWLKAALAVVSTSLASAGEAIPAADPSIQGLRIA